MYRGLGETARIDYAGASWCGSGNPFVDFFCPAEPERSTMEQIVMDQSNYGGHLSAESRARAEQMARDTIAADDPCNYSEINSMGWIEKVGCNLKDELGFSRRGGGTGGQDFTIVALIVAGVAAFSLLKH